jgi:hypothetical protein
MMWILAARDVPLHDDGSLPFWPDGQSVPLVWIIGLAAALMAVVFSWRAIVVFRRVKNQTEPTRQFLQVARGVGLGWPEIIALRRIADLEGLTTPLTLLVCPSTLNHHAESAAGKLPDRKAKPLRRHAARVADRLEA